MQWQPYLLLLLLGFVGVGVVALDSGLQQGPLNRIGGNSEVGYLDAVDIQIHPVIRCSLQENMSSNILAIARTAQMTWMSFYQETLWT